MTLNNNNNNNNTLSAAQQIASNTTAVQVALRVRPLTQQDRSQPRFSNSTDSDVIKTYEKSVAILPHQKSFQFDHVFDVNSTQEQVFTSVASNFVDRFIDGYNVTILAYGQTSSGKTYTMGTAIDDHSNPDQEGIIPRAMSALFQRLDDIQKQSSNTKPSPPPQQQQQQQSAITQNSIKRVHPSGLSTFPPTSGLRVPRRSASTAKLRPVSMITPPRRGSNTSLNASNSIPLNEKSTKYTVHVSFIEIYNEELIDLLNPAPPHERAPVTIREDTKGHIMWTGLKEVPVGSTEDVLKFLQMGTENRATGSTDMNAKSSRSHAIFSVTLKQEKWVPSSPNSTSKAAPSVSRSTASNTSSTLNHRHSTLNVRAMAAQMEKRSTSPTLASDEEEGEWMVSNSKFHFVDLAGSERLKRTAAQGDRRKEGININAGLLALGNVISALSDPSSKKSTHVPYRDSKLTRLLQDSLGGNSTTLMIACVSPAEINLTETINTIKYAYRARNIRNKTEKNETEEWMTSDNLDHLRQIISKLKAEVKMLKNSPHHRNSPSPMSSSGSGSPKAHTTIFAHSHHGIISPSSSSLSESDPHPSTCPSMSATTNITMPDSSTSLELCDAQNHGNHSNDVAIMVADLRRQIEELQNEVTVTRERNLLVEKELRQKSSAGGVADNEFQHLVEPVIEEYEKSISGLESQLAMANAALSHSDQALEDQQAKIAEYETMQANEVQALEELKARLSAAISREHSSETYCLELESQLEKSVIDGHRDQQILSELREKIMKFKEMDEHTEQYIGDLEARLSASELERSKLTEKIAGLAIIGAEPKNDKFDLKESTGDLSNQKVEQELLEKDLAECQTKCQKLEQELTLIKEQQRQEKKPQLADQASQSEDYIDEKKAVEIAELTALLAQKESQVQVLESRLDEINAMKSELSNLRQSHLEETTRLEENLNNLKTSHQTQLLQEQQRNQELQAALDTLTETHTKEINQTKLDYANLQQLMRQQEIASQTSLRDRLIELEKFKSDFNALHQVEEKQDAIIQGLESKLEEMDHLVSSLQTQLEERNQTIQLLEADNANKTKVAANMQKQLESVLKDVCGMGTEKKQLEQVISFVEGTLRLQDAKSDKSIETLEDIKHHYKVREEEIEEKRRTVNLLSAEKDELSQSLEQISQRASQGDAMVKNLESELSEARLSLTEHANLVIQLKQEQSQKEFEIQRMQALEARVQELDKEIELQQQAKLEKQKELAQLEHALQQQLVQNEGLIRTLAELETTIKEERALVSAHDSTGMVSELESKLTALQQVKKREDDVWKAQVEKTKEELYITRKENLEFKHKIEQLEISLAQVKRQIATATPVNSSFETITVDESEDDQDQDIDHVERILRLSNASSSDGSQQDLLDKIMLLQEDNAQLLKHNDNLESQLVLQRGQLTLETKNLELELMKLTAANDRLEKEMEQVIPRNNSGLAAHNRESVQFTSPPQTPRVSSPPPPTASNSTGSIIHYKLQRDISQSNIAKLSKSGSYRSVSTMLIDSNNAVSDEEALKRLSSMSMKSDIVPRPSSSLRSSRTLISSNNLPPPTAPPSNPLPPIPTPLPALPSAPSSPSLAGGDVSDHGSDPGSPSMHPITVGASSQPSLHRQDSTASTSFSEIMNSTSSANFTSEQYDKLIRSLQRKAQFAENDVRAHQEVISKLELQLSRSESSVREVKKQLDLLGREKQAYNLEIQNLRTQVTQIQTQQKTLSDESSVEVKELEEKLEQQKALKEKAEKARRILENRMDELMNKKSKFMCF